MDIIVVLDNIRSMHNIGSIFRTCDAIGECSIFLCGICATPPNKEIHKSALGATDSVHWKYFEETKDALLFLNKENYEIIAIEQTQTSIPLNNFSTGSNKIALIFGHEIYGVSEEGIQAAKECVEINQHGIKKSMNVSVAAGITLWKIKNK